jgi:hypothetical protein
MLMLLFHVPFIFLLCIKKYVSPNLNDLFCNAVKSVAHEILLMNYCIKAFCSVVASHHFNLLRSQQKLMLVPINCWYEILFISR